MKSVKEKRPAGQKQYYRRKKVCKFCVERIDSINYKDVKLLSQFVPERAKITPRRITGVNCSVSAVEFEYTKLDGQNRLDGTGDTLSVPADLVLKAVGQALVPPGDSVKVEKGRIVVDGSLATSLPGVWAGGDCVGTSVDLTVAAVEDGKRAARSIDAALRNGPR